MKDKESGSMNRKIKGLALVLSLFSSAVVMANAPDFPHLSTVGVSQIEAKPDMARVHVAVTILKQTAAESKDASDAAVAALLERLHKMGVQSKDIESANLSVQPQYKYQKNKDPKLLGYQSTRNVEVTVKDLTQLNSVLDGALVDGLNRVNNIEFLVSDRQSYQDKARMAAIEDAKTKAKMLAAGFELELDGVWQIRYQSAPSVRPMMMRSAPNVMADSIEESYMNTPVTFRDRVEVIFTLSE